MSGKNAEMVRQAYEAFGRGDRETMVADIAPTFTYEATGALPDAGTVHHGPEGWAQFVRWLSDQFEDARVEIHELVETGDQVLASATLRGRGRKSGAETSWHVWHLWTFQDGKLVHGRGFTDRVEAWEAAGLTE
jgi:uncharacterized protein